MLRSLVVAPLFVCFVPVSMFKLVLPLYVGGGLQSCEENCTAPHPKSDVRRPETQKLATISPAVPDPESLPGSSH